MSDVRGFGAVGDGVADDTQALRHALTAGNGILELRKGTYKITQPLNLDLSKSGYGAILGLGGTARIVMAGAGPAVRFIGTHVGTAVPASVTPQTWDRERFPTVSGVEILGAHPEAVGIEAQRTMQLTISNTLIRQCRHGIQLVERNRNVLISHCHIYDNLEYGIFFDHCNLHQTIITGCHISFNKRAGIYSIEGDVHNLQITGNDIEYNNRPGMTPTDGMPHSAEIWFVAKAGIISEVTIASNTIQATVEPGGANVRIHGGPDRQQRGACLITLIGNVLGSQTRSIELVQAMRVTVTGNTIYDGPEYSILAQHCRGLAIGENTFSWIGNDSVTPRDGIRLEDCQVSTLSGLVAERLCAGSPDAGGAVSLVRCQDVAVQGCQIIDSQYRGLDLEDCERCRITDNTIVDRRTPPLSPSAIRIRGASRTNLVQGNLVRGASGKLIDVSPEMGVVRENLEG